MLHKCKLCSHVTTQKWNLRIHCAIQHFHCLDCNESYESFKDQLLHRQNYHGCKVPKCSVPSCEVVKISQRDIARHEVLDHYRCRFCQKNFNSEDCKEHFHHMHPDKLYIFHKKSSPPKLRLKSNEKTEKPCPNSKKTLQKTEKPCPNSRKVSPQLPHDNTDKVSSYSETSCDICQLKLMVKSLKRHQTFSHFYCSDCKYQFQSSKECYDHYEAYHPEVSTHERFHECQLCQSHLKGLSAFERHQEKCTNHSKPKEPCFHFFPRPKLGKWIVLLSKMDLETDILTYNCHEFI